MSKNFIAFLERSGNAIEKNLSTKFRIPILQRSCELLGAFDNYSQIIAIDEWTEKFSLSKKLLLSFLSGNKNPELTPAEELKEFLLTFDISQNEITGELSIVKNKQNFTLEELEFIVDSENYKPTHLKKFLNQKNKSMTVVKSYNPLNDFFVKLADNYKGESLIKELSSCITAYDFGDKEPGFYQKRLEYYLQKWLYKASGQAMNIGKNDAMLLWVEPFGGSGKSYINRWLFSLPEFESYYLRISENASFIDMGGIAKGKFAIDWDELPLSQKRYLMFKSYTAMDTGQIYNKKTKSYESFNKMVNFIGSTNKANRERQKGFLLDDDDAMKRRILSVEISGRINYKKYLKDIDLYQLWGEASAGILQAQKSNNKNMLTYECDYNDLREQNNRYVDGKSKNDYSLIIDKYRPAEYGKGRLVNPSVILEELKEHGHKISLSKEALGLMLTKRGYIKGRVGNFKGYWVK